MNLKAHGTVGLAVIGCGTVGRIRAVLAREYPGIGWLGLCDVDEPTLKTLADGRIASIWYGKPNSDGMPDLKLMSPDGSSYGLLVSGVPIEDITCGG